LYFRRSGGCRAAALPPLDRDARRGSADRMRSHSIRNTKIIYFCRQTAYPAQKGAGAVQFLIQGFTVLGFEVQNWMLIVVGLIAAYILFVWKTRDRI
jgi:hypothetical protein